MTVFSCNVILIRPARALAQMRCLHDDMYIISTAIKWHQVFHVFKHLSSGIEWIRVPRKSVKIPGKGICFQREKGQHHVLRPVLVLDKRIFVSYLQCPYECSNPAKLSIYLSQCRLPAMLFVFLVGTSCFTFAVSVPIRFSPDANLLSAHGTRNYVCMSLVSTKTP